MSLITGAITSILLMSYIRNYILAMILGMLVAVIISGLSSPRELAIIGFLIGAVAGIYLGTTREINWVTVPAWNILAVMMLTSLLCAGYGYLTGKLRQVLSKGYGPF